MLHHFRLAHRVIRLEDGDRHGMPRRIYDDDFQFGVAIFLLAAYSLLFSCPAELPSEHRQAKWSGVSPLLLAP